MTGLSNGETYASFLHHNAGCQLASIQYEVRRSFAQNILRVTIEGSWMLGRAQCASPQTPGSFFQPESSSDGKTAALLPS